MEKLNHNERKTIQEYIKNKLDISSLIENKSLTNEDLSYSIIKKLSRTDEDLSGCNLAHAIIGDKDNIVSIVRCNIKNCNFTNTRFLGIVYARKCDFRFSNFSNAFMPYFEGQYSDFRSCIFCETILRIGSKAFLKAIFDDKTLGDWAQHSIWLGNDKT